MTQTESMSKADLQATGLADPTSSLKGTPGSSSTAILGSHSTQVGWPQTRGGRPGMSSSSARVCWTRLPAVCTPDHAVSLTCIHLDMPSLMCICLDMPCLTHVYTPDHALPLMCTCLDMLCLSCVHAWTCPASLMCSLLDMFSLFHMLFIVKHIEETGWWLCWCHSG